ncbi:MAG TPA: hypothetical protein VH482_15210 [Thermomicrobiales bacterium]
MSRSVFACRQCGHVLGHRHHSARLHVAPGVTVYVDPKGRAGPFVRLVCPVCQKHRDYRDGAVVVHADDRGGGSTSYTIHDRST